MKRPESVKHLDLPQEPATGEIVITKKTLYNYAKLITELRSAQRRYFSERKRGTKNASKALREAKALEQYLDLITSRIISKMEADAIRKKRSNES